MSLPATERLYYRDARCTEFDANIVQLDDSRTRVVLDRSAFYPTSGGQPFDTGVLGGSPVVDVTEEGDAVVHHLAAPLSTASVRLTGRVHWPRRFDHMQQHSGQHLLSAVLEDEFGWPTISVHFGAESSTLDVAAEVLPAEALREAEQMINALVTENRPISVSFESSGDITGLRKPSDRAGLLRVVTIAGLDKNACGGTHVSHTGDIGPILLRRTERVRGGTRLEFRCGARAIQRARADFDVVQQIAASFSAAIDDLPSLVGLLHADAQKTEKEVARLVELLAAHEAHALYQQTTPNARGRRVYHESVSDAPVKSRQSVAHQYAQHSTAVFVSVSHTPPALLLAASADSGIDCGRVLKETLHAVGGRGGGTSALAQGSVPTLDAAEIARERLLATLRDEGLPAR